MYGYHGRFLEVDLSAGTTTEIPLSDAEEPSFAGRDGRQGIGLVGHLGGDDAGKLSEVSGVFRMSNLVGGERQPSPVAEL